MDTGESLVYSHRTIAEEDCWEDVTVEWSCTFAEERSMRVVKVWYYGVDGIELDEKTVIMSPRAAIVVLRI